MLAALREALPAVAKRTVDTLTDEVPAYGRADLGTDMAASIEGAVEMALGAFLRPGRRGPGRRPHPAARRRRSRPPTRSAGARPAPGGRSTRCWPRTGSAPGSRGGSCRPRWWTGGVDAGDHRPLRRAGLRVHRPAVGLERRRPRRRARHLRPGPRAVPRAARPRPPRRRAASTGWRPGPSGPTGRRPTTLTAVRAPGGPPARRPPAPRPPDARGVRRRRAGRGRRHRRPARPRRATAAAPRCSRALARPRRGRGSDAAVERRAGVATDAPVRAIDAPARADGRARSTPTPTSSSSCSAPTPTPSTTCATHALAPLADLRPATAERLTETLRAWLLHQGRREEVAADAPGPPPDRPLPHDPAARPLRRPAHRAPDGRSSWSSRSALR